MHGTQVQRLAHHVKMGGTYDGQKLDRLHGTPGRNKRQGVDRLIVHLGRLDMRTEGWARYTEPQAPATRRTPHFSLNGWI